MAEKNTANEEVDSRKKLELPEMVTVGELAEKLEMPTTKLVGELFRQGIMATVNQKIDFEKIGRAHV